MEEPDHVARILAQWHAERPDLDVAPMGTIGRLGRLSQVLSQEMGRVFAAHGLTAAGFDVLATLRRSGPPFALTPSALIASTMVTSGTMTNRLDRLEEAGLVTRARNPEDGRGFVVGLTAQGRAAIDAAVSKHVATQHRLMAALTPAERAALDAILTRWLDAFEAEGGESG